MDLQRTIRIEQMREEIAKTDELIEKFEKYKKSLEFCIQGLLDKEIA